MKIEDITLKFQRYYDDNDLPTCAVSFDKNLVCNFYGTKTFGSREMCMYHNKVLHRRNKDFGTLIPLDSCPLWNETT